MTKLHKRDTMSSYDEFLCYAQPYKLILTTSTTHPVNNETPNLYSKGATLSILIHEGRLTTTKLTLVDLPSSIFHRPFYLPRMFERYTLSCTYFPSESFDETGCDYLVFPTPGKKEHVTVDIYYLLEDQKGIHTEEIYFYLTSRSGTTFQAGIQSSNSLIKSMQKLLVPASTSTLKSSTLIRRQIPTFLRPTFTTTQVTSSYDTYTTALATQTTSATFEITNDKSLHLQVNRLNIA